MSEARVNNLSNESNTGGPTITGITTFSGTNYFVPPVGNTAERPDNPQKGALRFNTDSKHLEYYRGDTIGWSEIEASHGQLGGVPLFLGSEALSNTGTGARGVFFGRATPTIVNDIDFVTIPTFGNAQDFGDMSGVSYTYGTTSSKVRGFCAGGSNPHADVIDFITFSSTGNATDTGNLTQARYQLAGGVNDSTRSIFGGGDHYGSPNAHYNILDYITSATGGDAVDFGDLAGGSKRMCACMSSSTRGIFAGGNPGPASTNVIEYITISTTGNSEDFGDISSYNLKEGRGCSNSTRGLLAGGYSPNVNTIEYITMATFGNGIDFGDMDFARSHFASAASQLRALWASSLNNTATIDSVEILTTGNAVDFGDLTNGGHNADGTSNAHGGLG